MHNDQYTVLLAIGLLLIFIPAVQAGCRRIGVPAVVGFLLLGLLAASADREGALFQNPTVVGPLSVMAQLGVVVLLFRVGLKSHLESLLAKLPAASLIWICNVAGSFAVGYGLVRYGFGASIATALVIGTAFSATSIAVAVTVWDELGLATSEAGSLLLDIAELDDLSAAVLLAVILGVLPALESNGNVTGGELSAHLGLSLGTLLLFIGGCFLFSRFLEPRFSALQHRLGEDRSGYTIGILGAGLLMAALAEGLGFSAAIGALFAGIAFSRDSTAVGSDEQLAAITALLGPFFFVYIGLQTDLGALAGALDTGLLLFLAAAAAKYLFTFLPALRVVSPQEARALATSMIPRAEIALVVLFQSRAVAPGVIDDDLFTAMVVVATLSCLLAPIVLRQQLRGGVG